MWCLHVCQVYTPSPKSLHMANRQRIFYESCFHRALHICIWPQTYLVELANFDRNYNAPRIKYRTLSKVMSTKWQHCFPSRNPLLCIAMRYSFSYKSTRIYVFSYVPPTHIICLIYGPSEVDIMSNRIRMHCLRFVYTCSGGSRGGGAIGRGPPPPYFQPIFCFCFAFHPWGRSGRRTVPLLHNVLSDAKKKFWKKKNVSESPPPPPPPPAERLFQAWRGIWIPGPPFSQILDPPLYMYTLWIPNTSLSSCGKLPLRCRIVFHVCHGNKWIKW